LSVAIRRVRRAGPPVVILSPFRMPTIQTAGSPERAASPASAAPSRGPDDPGGESRPSILRIDLSVGAAVADAVRAVLDPVRWLAGKAGAELGLVGELRVRIVGDAEMAAAHLAHCGVSGTTDVITMDLRDSPGAAARDGVLDADILVCANEAARQSSARGVNLEHELTLYILHAMLHCMGFDDHDDAAYAAMHAREDRVLAAIGVGTVFAQPERGAPATEDGPSA